MCVRHSPPSRGSKGGGGVGGFTFFIAETKEVVDLGRRLVRK